MTAWSLEVGLWGGLLGLGFFVLIFVCLPLVVSKQVLSALLPSVSSGRKAVQKLYVPKSEKGRKFSVNRNE